MSRAFLLVPLRVLYLLWLIASFMAVGLITLGLLILLPRLSQRRAAARALARVFLHLAGHAPQRALRGTPAGRPVRGGVQSRQLPGRHRAHRRVAAAIWLRHQARDGLRAPGRCTAEAAGFAVRRAFRPAAQRRGCAPRIAQRQPGSLGRFLPRRHVHPHPGPAEISPRRVRDGRARRLSARAGGGPRHAPRSPPSGALPVPGRDRIDDPAALGAAAEAPDEHAAPKLREAARSAMLAALGEPDLTCCDDTDRPPDTAHARSAPASRP